MKCLQLYPILLGSIAISTGPAPILGHARRLSQRLRHILNIVHVLWFIRATMK